VPRNTDALGNGVVVIADHLRRRVPGGIGTYTSALIDALIRLPNDERPPIRLFASRPPRGVDPLSAFGVPVESSILPSRLMSRLFELGVPRVGDRAALVHATSLLTPKTDVPLTVALHDIAFRAVPEAFTAHGRRWHERALGRVARQAACCIVPSEQTVAALADAAVGIGEDRLAVVEYGADHLPPADEEGTAALLKRVGVEGEFLCSVGTLEPRKNLPRLLAAYERARGEFPEPWPLVVVGPPGWGETVTAKAGVIFLGEVSPAVLAGLYRRARLVAYVPLIEGFGLPVAEAMWAGTPVVASPVPSSNGAALEVEPTDVDAISDALVRMASDDVLRAVAVARGRVRAAELTWERTARGNLAVWRRLAG
jgi:glycosyltransferase involved in cell wall biosynthesis